MLTYHKTTEEEKYRITAGSMTATMLSITARPYAQQKQTGFRLCQPEESLLFLL